MYPSSFSAVIWDWNGTLLNDVEHSMNSMNLMLSERNLPLLTVERYRKIFTFPVQDYYQKIGFDFSREDFNIVGAGFIDLYNAGVFENAKPFTEVKPLLESIRRKGIRQYILSAMMEDHLIGHLKNYKLDVFFDEIAGIDDVLAAGKIERGRKLLSKLPYSPERICFIGDTLHDYEVAEELGCSAALIAQGHQDYQRLKKSGAEVFMDFEGLSRFLRSRFQEKSAGQHP